MIWAGAVLFLGAAYAVYVYNSLVGYQVESDNAWKQIDVQLKRRYDLIPNLVEVVRGYMKYEQDTLVRVTEARSSGLAARGPSEAAKADRETAGLLRQLFAVIESYPELKANQNALRLQEELTSTENRIAFSRSYYNNIVANYTALQKRFPSSIIAGIYKFPPREYFGALEEEKAVPGVRLP